MRWFCALVVGGVLSGFAFLLLTGRYINDGPVVATVNEGQGLHAGDFFIIAGWLVAMLAVVALVTAPRRYSSSHPTP